MPVVAENPTAAFVAKFNDPSQWQIVKGVPIFDAHDEVYEEPEVDPKTGRRVIDPATGKPRMRKVVEKFDRASLEKHAQNCNALVASGNPPGLVDGHTLDDAPESKQPETLGFARDFRVEYSPILQRDVIVQDEYYFPDKYEIAKSRPYRSVERFKSAAVFKPVALLRREPRRNLGVVAYKRGDDVAVRYSLDSYRNSERYAMPDAVMDSPPMEAAPAAPAPDAQMSMEPSDKDKQIFAALCKHYGLQITDPAAAPAAPAPAAPPAAPAAPEKNAAMPSASNVAVPAMAEPAEKPKEEKEKMQAHGDVERYARELSDARSRIATLEKDARLTRYGAALGDLRREYQFDEAEELAEVQDFTEDQFKARCEKIKKCYAKLPRDGKGGPIRLADMPRPEDAQSGPRFTKDQMEKALRYKAEHPGMSWETAKDAVVKGLNGAAH